MFCSVGSFKIGVLDELDKKMRDIEAGGEKNLQQASWDVFRIHHQVFFWHRALESFLKLVCFVAALAIHI